MLSHKFHEIKVACYLNISLCHTRRRKPHLVIYETTKILETLKPLSIDAHVKALYRRAMALKMEDRLEEALEDLEEANYLQSPESAGKGVTRDPAVVKEYRELSVKLQQIKETEFRNYSQLFNGEGDGSDEATNETPTSTITQQE